MARTIDFESVIDILPTPKPEECHCCYTLNRALVNYIQYVAFDDNVRFKFQPDRNIDTIILNWIRMLPSYQISTILKTP